MPIPGNNLRDNSFMEHNPPPVTNQELTFDDIYLNAPLVSTEDKAAAIQVMRAESSLLISQQAEVFCREIVLHGRLPTRAYEIAFAVQDAELGQWVIPDNPSWNASKLLRTPEVVGRIKEIRDEMVSWGGRIEREEIINSLRAILLDPDSKAADKLGASKQLSQLEAFEKAPDTQAGGTLVIQLPFSPDQLKNIGSGSILDSEAETL